MPAHNIAHCNTPSGIAKRPRVYVPRIAADKCRAYAEFVRFIAKRDTCYGTRDTKAIAQRSRGTHPNVCCPAIIPRETDSDYFPQDWGKLMPPRTFVARIILFLQFTVSYNLISSSFLRLFRES